MNLVNGAVVTVKGNALTTVGPVGLLVGALVPPPL
jgi:hypothetical protein